MQRIVLSFRNDLHDINNCRIRCIERSVLPIWPDGMRVEFNLLPVGSVLRNHLLFGRTNVLERNMRHIVSLWGNTLRNHLLRYHFVSYMLQRPVHFHMRAEPNLSKWHLHLSTGHNAMWQGMLWVGIDLS